MRSLGLPNQSWKCLGEELYCIGIVCSISRKHVEPITSCWQKLFSQVFQKWSSNQPISVILAQTTIKAYYCARLLWSQGGWTGQIVPKGCVCVCVCVCVYVCVCVTQSGDDCLERATTGQPENLVWKSACHIQLTTSNFGQVCKRRMGRVPGNLLKQCCRRHIGIQRWE